MQRGTRWSYGLLAVPCLCGCLYDRDDRCGRHQQYVNGICVCDEGYTLGERECVAGAEMDAGGAPVADAQVMGDAADDAGVREPYSGQREPCVSSDDCAGFDATYCNPVLSICMVPDCTEDSCDPGYMCFDLSMFAPGEPTVCLHPSDIPQ